jgi:hypothetical protein
VGTRRRSVQLGERWRTTPIHRIGLWTRDTSDALAGPPDCPSCSTKRIAGYWAAASEPPARRAETASLRVGNASPRASQGARSRTCTPSILHRFAALRLAFSPRVDGHHGGVTASYHLSTPKSRGTAAMAVAHPRAAKSSPRNSELGRLSRRSLPSGCASGGEETGDTLSLAGGCRQPGGELRWGNVWPVGAGGSISRACLPTGAPKRLS